MSPTSKGIEVAGRVLFVAEVIPIDPLDCVDLAVGNSNAVVDHQFGEGFTVNENDPRMESAFGGML